MAHMDEAGQLALSGHLEQVQNFLARRIRQIVNAESDAERPVVQALPDMLANLPNLGGRGGTVRRGFAWREAAGVAHDRHRSRDVARCRTEVDERSVLPLRIPGLHRPHAEL